MTRLLSLSEMIKNARTIYVIIGLFVGTAPTLVRAEEAINPRTVMQSVFDRDDGRSQVSLIRVSTCKYAKTGRSISCTETPREKVIQQFAKDYGPNGKDTKGLTILVKPVSERGVGFLQYDYDDDARDSDQWIYLSALGKVKRIASGDSDQPKTGSFFGSEITFEDLEARKLNNYTYTYLQSESYRKRPCWVIESRPTDVYRSRTSYGKSLDWVDKDRNLVLKRILFDRKGRKVKRMTFKGVENIDGIWVVRKIEVNNLMTSRISIINVEAIKLNVDIGDPYFTQRSLTNQSFRERLMTQFSHIVK